VPGIDLHFHWVGFNAVDSGRTDLGQHAEVMREPLRKRNMESILGGKLGGFSRVFKWYPAVSSGIQRYPPILAEGHCRARRWKIGDQGTKGLRDQGTTEKSTDDGSQRGSRTLRHAYARRLLPG